MSYHNLGKFVPLGLRRFVYRRRRDMTRLRNKMTVKDNLLTYHGVCLRVDPKQIGAEVAENLLSGDYEQREVRMIKMFLERHDTVVELGAGIGFIGMLCARTVGGKNVHSFEANPLMKDVITGNYALNEGDPPTLNIGFLSASTEETGDVAFYVPDEFWAASLSPLENAKIVYTPKLSLNTQLAKLKPSFLVMDIEGGEIDIVNALEPGSICKIAMELHPHVTGQKAIDDMVIRLKSLGFTRRWMSSSGQHMYFEAS